MTATVMYRRTLDTNMYIVVQMKLMDTGQKYMTDEIQEDAYNNNKRQRLQNDFKYTAQRIFNEKMTQDS